MIGVYACCKACGEESSDPKEVYENFETHEVSEGVHTTFCKPCVKVLELNEGK